MASPKGKKETCSRGHVFYKSSDCPVCPKCWSGYYRKKQSDFPVALSAPALRALLHANISSLKKLATHTEKEIADLHGMGPKGITMLEAALKQKKLSFKK
jgi:hypothetical protein